jgi:3'(2'), 5'-bisphosphate nucleotidase
VKKNYQNVELALETAKDAAIEAGKIIMEIYQSPNFLEAIQPGEFPSTSADKRSHQVILDSLGKTNLPVLSEEGPTITVNERSRWEYFWLIDPLDGTKEFINKNDEFTVSIALIKKNMPIVGVIYVPCTSALYYGSKETGVYKSVHGKLIHFSPLTKRKAFGDLLQKEQLTVVGSRSHLSTGTKEFIDQFKKVKLILLGSSLKFMLLLENKADIYPRLGPTMEWDTAAAHAILNGVNRGIYQMDLKTELQYNKPELKNPFFIAY